MKIEKRSGGDERQILIGMIVADVVCGRIAGRWPKHEGLFASRWANLVAGWCVMYHGRYGAAPGRAIEGMFRAWAEGDRNPDDIKLVEKFLKSLNRQYEEMRQGINPQYVVDLAGTYFNRVALARHAEALQGDLDTGNIDAALQRANGYGRVELGGGSWLDPMSTKEAFQRAYDYNKECLVDYPGALGEFFRQAFRRDSFVAFMAKEKGKKSFWLLDIVWRAALQRRRVAYFEVGDLSEEQVMQRWGVRAAAWPEHPGTIKIPRSIERTEDGAHVEHEEKVFKTGITWQKAAEACERVVVKQLRTKEPLVRLSCHPNSSISVNGIRTHIQNWERENWVPDVIVVDYADILAPPAGSGEGRDQINASWKQLRALSQETHSLVVTATQADAESYGAHTLSRRNFSDDKRKYAHVTAMVGINETPEEYEMGVQRLNWLVTRSFQSSERRCVYVAGCAGIAAPAMKSTW